MTIPQHPLPTGVWRHVKTDCLYVVLAVARLDLQDCPEYDDVPAVVYCRLYSRAGLPVSVRPLDEFLGEVEDGRPRFEYVGAVDPGPAAQ